MSSIFSDLDLTLTLHPVTGDIVAIKDVNAVKNSIKNLVLTNFYERKFKKHNIGSPLNRLLFEPTTPFLSANIQRAVTQVIENYEPRVELDDVLVKVDDDNNSVSVIVFFRIVGTLTPISVQITLKRTR